MSAASIYTNPNTGDVTFDKNVSANNVNMFRNRVINGNMALDTRNAAGVAGVSAATAVNIDSVDKWQIATGQYSPSVTAQQVALSSADQTTTGQTTAVQITPANIPMGLGAYFPFEGTLRDASGNGVTLTPTGTMMYVPGKVGTNALYLANEANVSAGNAPVNYITSSYTFPSYFSVSCWVYSGVITSANNKFIFNTNNTSSTQNNALGIYITSTSLLGITYYNVNYIVTASAISVNTWYHVVLVYNNGPASVYVNGSQVGSTISPSTSLYQSGFILGNGFIGNNQPFAGYIDDFRIYNRVLSATEIAALAALTPFQPTLPAASGLIHYYPFDGSLTNAGTAGGSLTSTGTMNYAGGLVGTQCLYLANEANVTAGTAAANYLTRSYTFPSTFTVSMWVNSTKINSSINMVIFNMNNTNAAINNTITLYFAGSTNTINFGYWGGGPNQGPSIYINTWYHICITYTGSNILFYVNGAYINSLSFSSVSLNNGFILGNGHTTNLQPFAGYIDDFRIYDTVLSPAQIAAIYYSTNTAYVNLQQTIDGAALADFQWGTANAQSAMLSTWIKNNSLLAQAYTLSLNSTGLIGYLPFDNSYADAAGGGFLSAPQVLSSTTFTSTAGNFKIGTHALDLSGNPVGGTAVSGLRYYTSLINSLPLSISLWFNANTTASPGNYQILVSLANENTAVNGGVVSNIGIRVTSGYLYAWYGTDVNTSVVPSAGVYNHLSLIITPSGNRILYLNGIQIGFTSGTTSSLITKLSIGQEYTGLYAFKGYIDDVRIYNRALTPAQVKALYDANASSTTAPTAASITLPARSLVYNTPSIPANSWQQVQVTIPGDSTGSWETRAGYPAATLALSLGAGPSYSNVTTGVWVNNIEYNGGTGTQLINYSANNFLASSSNAVLMTGVQLEKGTIATGFEYRNNNVENVLSGLSYPQWYMVSTSSGPISWSANFNTQYIGKTGYGSWTCTAVGYGASSSDWSQSTGIWTAPLSGIYIVVVSIYNQGSTAVGFIALNVGSASYTFAQGQSQAGQDTVNNYTNFFPINSGTNIYVAGTTTASPTLYFSSSLTYMRIIKIG